MKDVWIHSGRTDKRVDFSIGKQVEVSNGAVPLRSGTALVRHESQN